MLWHTILSIIVIGCLEALAIMKGIDGASLAASLAVIGGLGGYGIKAARARKDKAIKPPG